MHKTSQRLAWGIFGVLSFLACQSQKAGLVGPETLDKAQGTQYILVWSDEFDKAGRPDPDKWAYEKGFVRNQELQWYQEENAFVENGLLVIEGRRDTFPNPGYDANSGEWRKRREQVYFTSSSLKSQGKFSQRYGRWEIRARIQAEEGLWPAIWTLGDGHEWPQGGEIDIMEYYGGNILANAAWAGENRWQAIWDASRTPMSSFPAAWDSDFHIWRMDWTIDFIKIFVDDQLLNTIPLNKTHNQRGNIGNPFRETLHYILLNLAIGGTNGGDPTATQFPTRYEVDYVRVYKEK